MNEDPTFPFLEENENADMLLRDYFAAKAMQAFRSNASLLGYRASEIAKNAYLIADEMMKARGERRD